MRARPPDRSGTFTAEDGVSIGYEVFEPAGRDAARRNVVFLPTDPIVHSRVWKAQVPYVSRHARVLTIDPRGNGRSGRPADPAAYSDERYVADTVAVMDHVGIERALLVGICSSAWWTFLLAARHPERASGVFTVASWVPYLADPIPERALHPWDVELDTDEGWAKDNKYYWQRDFDGYLQYFFDTIASDPHSTKIVEDCLSWGRQTDAAALTAEQEAPLSVSSPEEVRAVLRAVSCPVLAVHGEADTCQTIEHSERAAALSGGRYVALPGAGHLPMARYPVVVNHLLVDFLDEVDPPPARPAPAWRPSMGRPRRVLFLSSPIGLGHSRRDIAIAEQLRDLRPGVEVEWLTQDPVARMLRESGERLHPASAWLANESAHMESECGEHSLDAFQAIRSMDEILVNNFMVFDELTRSEPYDLVIADESWEVDHFLHENPELKRQPFAWLTDFVGWVPFPEHGPEDARLTRDYNAEMVEHVERYPRLRDRAVFVGDPEDCLPDSLGEGLPGIREWTEQHFDFAGHVTGFEPVPARDVEGVRADLGYLPGEQVCIVSVGGSGVGLGLLRLVASCYPIAAQQVPGLRMVVVAGPRIDPDAVGAPPGVEVRGYVPGLWRHLAVCDLAVVQGGLTTTMELVANRRPFLYVPLRDHFEQQFHVTHRLRRHRAGRRTDIEELRDPELFAKTLADEIGREVDYLDVPSDGARRAAARLADLF